MFSGAVDEELHLFGYRRVYWFKLPVGSGIPLVEPSVIGQGDEFSLEKQSDTLTLKTVRWRILWRLKASAFD